MKNNLHTELRKQIKEKFAEKFGNLYLCPIPVQNVIGHRGGTKYNLQQINPDDIFEAVSKLLKELKK